MCVQDATVTPSGRIASILVPFPKRSPAAVWWIRPLLVRVSVSWVSVLLEEPDLHTILIQGSCVKIQPSICREVSSTPGVRATVSRAGPMNRGNGSGRAEGRARAGFDHVQSTERGTIPER